jgi:hypothetical protein
MTWPRFCLGCIQRLTGEATGSWLGGTWPMQKYAVATTVFARLQRRERRHQLGAGWTDNLQLGLLVDDGVEVVVDRVPVQLAIVLLGGARHAILLEQL